jgi:hypothetical protein
MQKKRRNGRASTETSGEDEIAHLRGLDSRGLRSRWQSVFQRSAPAHLTRHLLFGVIAYRIQVDRYGDLDHATRQVSYDADRSAGLHNDCISLARGSGRSANAVPGIFATAQRGHRGLERGDESTAIAALRSIISCLLSRGGDT